MNQDVNILGLILDLKDNATPALRTFNRGLSTAMSGVDKFVTGFNNMEKDLERSSKKTNGFIKNMFTGTDQVMKKQLKDADSTLIQFAKLSGDMNKVVEARYKEFSTRMEEQSAKLHRTIMGSVALSMSGISAMNFSRPIIQGFGEMIKQAGDFSETMKKIQLATADFNGQMGEALDKSNKLISKTVMSAGIASPLSPKETAQMANSLATMGFHDVKTLNSLIAPAMLMQANSATEADGGLSPVQASQLVSNLLIQQGKGIGPTKNMKLAGQNFEGVSTNGLSINNMVMKSLHDAHLTSTDVLGYQSSAGSALATSGMSLPDFLAIGGAMKREGIQVRTAGRDIQGLVNRAGLFDAQNATKPTALSKQAEAIGLTMSNLKGGNFLEKLTVVYDKAIQLYGSKAPEVLGRLANATGKNVFTSIENLNKERKAGNIEMNALEMSKDIARAGVEGDGEGYAEKRFNELSKQFPMAWKQFTGSLAGLGQIIGASVLPPITELVIKLTNLTGKLMEFAQKHPLLTKILGFGAGFAGLFLMAGGVIALFAGQIISAVASLNNFRLQMAMATATVNDFKKESMSANILLGERGLTNVFGSLAMKVLGFTAILGAGYLAWTNDIAGFKTAILGLRDKAVATWENMLGLTKAYESGSLEAFQRQRVGLARAGEDWYKFAKFLVDVSLVFKAVVNYWKTEQIPIDKFKILQDEGLVPVLDTIFKLKHEGKAFFDGFKKGMTGFLDTAKTTFAPFIAMAKPILTFFHLDGLFGGGDKPNKDGATAFGETIGKISKYLIIGLVAVRLYSKALKGIGKIISGGWGVGKGILNFGTIWHKEGFLEASKSVRSAIFKGAKGALSKALGEDAAAIVFVVSRAVGKGIKLGARTFDRDRINQLPATVREKKYPLNWGNRPTPKGGGYKPGGPGYEDFWMQNTRSHRLNARDTKELESRAAYATTKAQRKVYDDALREHKRGKLNMPLQDIVQLAEGGQGTKRQRNRLVIDNPVNRGDVYIPQSAGYKKKKNVFSRFWDGWKNRSNRQGIVAGGDLFGEFSHMGNGKGGKVAVEGLTAGAKPTGKMGKVGKGLMSGVKGLGTAGKFALKGAGKLLGPVGLALGMLTDIPQMMETIKKDGVVKGVGDALGVSRKGGVGGALSGAASGAMMGMAFGPIGAAVGAAVGAAIGGIGTDKIMVGVKAASTKVGEWWNSFAKSDFGKPLVEVFGNSFNTMKKVGADQFILLKDIFTGNWKNVGKDLSKIWEDFTTGFKTHVAIMFNSPLGKAIAKLFGIDIAALIKPTVKTDRLPLVGSSNSTESNSASGLPYVPYDNYKINAHKGEMLLTENEANGFRKAQTASTPASSGGNTSVVFEQGSIQISMANASAAEIERAADEMFKKFMKKIENKNIANYQPSRMRGSV